MKKWQEKFLKQLEKVKGDYRWFLEGYGTPTSIRGHRIKGDHDQGGLHHRFCPLTGIAEKMKPNPDHTYQVCHYINAANILKYTDHQMKVIIHTADGECDSKCAMSGSSFDPEFRQAMLEVLGL